MWVVRAVWLRVVKRSEQSGISGVSAVAGYMVALVLSGGGLV